MLKNDPGLAGVGIGKAFNKQTNKHKAYMAKMRENSIAQEKLLKCQESTQGQEAAVMVNLHHQKDQSCRTSSHILTVLQG